MYKYRQILFVVESLNKVVLSIRSLLYIYKTFGGEAIQ
jgi:hypothetical protein